jgi:hypothetical protein
VGAAVAERESETKYMKGSERSQSGKPLKQILNRVVFSSKKDDRAVFLVLFDTSMNEL